jgi:fused signal recognition particle receptor
MAEFNWFSRSHDAAKASESSPKADDAKSEALSATESATATDKPAPASSEDYLAWAKAAYQNIQKQQTAPTEPAPVPDTETTRQEEAAAPTDAVAVEDTPDEESSETETPVASTESTESAAPTESAAATEPESSPANQPAWMQASTERQARLERLQETAIAEPEPEPEPTPITATAPTAVPMVDLEFDEAFLWSAEVLAAQGRRAEDISVEEITWLNKLRQGLDKTRRGLINQLKAIVGQGPLNDDAVMEIEALLLQADVGVAATDIIIEGLQTRLGKKPYRQTRRSPSSNPCCGTCWMPPCRKATT